MTRSAIIRRAAHDFRALALARAVLVHSVMHNKKNKLALVRETLLSLTDTELLNVNGGTTPATPHTPRISQASAKGAELASKASRATVEGAKYVSDKAVNFSIGVSGYLASKAIEKQNNP
jgi:hypothetical protein